MHNASLEIFAALHTELETKPILGGDTTVTLTSAATLQMLGIEVTPLGSATVDAGGADPLAFFPITGGTAGPEPDIAVILHQGSGLQLAAEAGTVDLRDFRIDTLNGVIDANVSVNGDLAGNVPAFSLGADGTTLTLTPLAAGVLDETLGTMAITPEVVIGLAAPSPVTNPHDVTATPGRDTTPFTGGDTLVTLTSAATLASLGIDVAPLGSASLHASDEAPVADFPITGGTAGPGADLVILHQGSGLTLSNHLGSLDLSDFLIDTLNGVVDANVAVNGVAAGNVPVFSLGANGATLTLTPFAAEAVNAVLGTTEITPEVEIGIAAPMPDLLFA